MPNFKSKPMRELEDEKSFFDKCDEERELYGEPTDEEIGDEEKLMDMWIEERNRAERVNPTPIKIQIREARFRALVSCLRYRRLIQKMDMDMFHGWLRNAQIRLVKVREWRRAGIYPGEA